MVNTISSLTSVWNTVTSDWLPHEWWVPSVASHPLRVMSSPTIRWLTYPVCMFIPPHTQFVCLFPHIPSLFILPHTQLVHLFPHIPSLYIYSSTHPVCMFIPPHTQFVHLFLHTPSLYVYSSTHPVCMFIPPHTQMPATPRWCRSPHRCQRRQPHLTTPTSTPQSPHLCPDAPPTPPTGKRSAFSAKYFTSDTSLCVLLSCHWPWLWRETWADAWHQTCFQQWCWFGVYPS